MAIESQSDLWAAIQSNAPEHAKSSKKREPLPETCSCDPDDSLIDYTDLLESMSSSGPPEPEFTISSLLEGTSVAGFDLSLASTGVYLHQDGVDYSYTLPPLTTDSEDIHYEVRLRRELEDLIMGTLPPSVDPHFDHISVEDAFSGRSRSVARTLYSINTAIDELILDSCLHTPNFHRVNNVSWKSSWSNMVGKDLVSHSNAKDRVRAFLSYSYHTESATCLNYLETLAAPDGSPNPPKGTQDRLDAYALAIHPLLDHAPKRKSVPWSDIRVFTADDIEDLISELPPERVVWPYKSTLSRKAIRTTLSANPHKVLATPRPVLLGTLDTRSHGSDRLVPQFAAFWVRNPD